MIRWLLLLLFPICLRAQPLPPNTLILRDGDTLRNVSNIEWTAKKFRFDVPEPDGVTIKRTLHPGAIAWYQNEAGVVHRSINVNTYIENNSPLMQIDYFFEQQSKNKTTELAAVLFEGEYILVLGLKYLPQPNTGDTKVTTPFVAKRVGTTYSMLLMCPVKIKTVRSYFADWPEASKFKFTKNEIVATAKAYEAYKQSRKAANAGATN